MLDRPPGQPSGEQRCPRCDDGKVTTPGWVVCDPCVEAAHRAIAARPGQVVTPADIEAARLGG